CESSCLACEECAERNVLPSTPVLCRARRIAGLGGISTDRRLPLRPRPLRSHRAARLGGVLPLQALPAAHRDCRVPLGADRYRLAADPLRGGADPLLRSAGRLREGVLLRL